jgi:diguanylate cyclase (GGDEF)-like protein
MRLAGMRTQLDLLQNDPSNVEAAATLGRDFHALSGLGGTYGFPHVTGLAEEAEAVLLPILKAPEPIDPQLLVRWRVLLDAIEREIRGEALESQPSFDVLLVEADPELAATIGHALAVESMTVRSVTTHEAALAELDFRVPDALIVNTILPDGSGLDVLRRVNETGDATVGSIVLSTSTDFGTKVEAIRQGANAVLPVPLEIASLVRRVCSFRERRVRQPARVLAVEDDPAQSLIIRTILGRAGYAVTICSEPSQFEAALSAVVPDLLLMDIHLDQKNGDVSGFDLVRILRQNEQYSSLPVIFVSGDTERDALLESALCGGDTLVTKPVDWGLLLSQISARLERASAIRELTERDAVTGVLTRSAFQARVRERMALQPEGPCWVVVLLDIDHFKRVNDTYGHQAGDRVLSVLGACLRRGVRRHDLVGRYGGEEFVLLLEELTIEQAAQLTERLLEEFRTLDHPGGEALTFSAGVAGFFGSFEESARRADSALYDAKRSGRARVVRS